MQVKVGTFNLNNLFSRFNFSASINEIQGGALTVRYEFTDGDHFRIRTFMGKLVKAKKDKDTKAIADRIKLLDLDVLAVQEVENIDILREFNRDALGGLYPHQVLLEGNDPRLIDVAVLSKLPLGAVTSYQTAVHPDDPSQTVFGRDLLEVDVLSPSRSMRLFTLYNNHLKSHFGDDDDGGAGKAGNDARRLRQAQTVQRLVAARMRPNSRYIITGDMNDGPDDAPLAPLLTVEGQSLINGLAQAQENKPPKPEKPGEEPASPIWTHRFRKGGPPEHRLFDQIWLSPALAPALGPAFIDRRTKHGGDGSDHDPAWVELDI